ncbi:MAG: endolytic transglycosylase MltG [Oscillospiraceae bacterium]|nr:endolytic transglycosylase MltG [Oscillospiraceae bacterium]
MENFESERPITSDPEEQTGESAVAAQPWEDPVLFLQEEPAEQVEATIPEEEEPSPKKKKKKKGKWPRWARVMVSATVILCISVLLSFALLVAINDVVGFVKPDAEVNFFVDKGMTGTQVAEQLEKEGVIHSSLLFRLYLRMNETGGDFQYGYHKINANFSYEQILIELQTVTVKAEDVEITFPEGISLMEIAKKLEEAGVIEDAEDFVSYTNRTNFGYDFEDEIPEEPLRFNRLEGYFYPDTYRFIQGESYDTIVHRFLKNFSLKMTADIYKEIDATGRNLYDVLTLASIVQAESSNTSTMGLVASVFTNRLNNADTFPKLQSDVTDNYATKWIKPYMELENQEMLDAYDTYLSDGLTPGPINNPSKEAIRAVVFPEESNYFYFVTDKNGKFYWARTLAQHNANVRRARAVK